MEFSESIRQFSDHIANMAEESKTEEATKMSMIVPLFQLLGYNVFDPSEFQPEYTADVGIKKGERVDYAILENGEPVILIECKSCTEHLGNQSSQLFRYFGTTHAKFGILTNGIIYQFFTDLDEANRMDLVPFLEIDMLNLTSSAINELKKFRKETFDKETIFSSAEELKYDILVKDWLAREFESPSEDFVRFILKELYPGKKSQQVVDKFTPLIKRSMSSYITETVNNKITAALIEEPEQLEAPIEDTDSKIVTTAAEIEAFYIVRGMLVGVVPIEDIAQRDTESYFGILYQDNNRKPICRLNLDTKKKQIFIPDKDKNFERFYIESLNDLYKFKQSLIAVVKRYM